MLAKDNFLIKYFLKILLIILLKIFLIVTFYMAIEVEISQFCHKRILNLFQIVQFKNYSIVS
jgi:hypothetical protein